MSWSYIYQYYYNGLKGGPKIFYKIVQTKKCLKNIGLINVMVKTYKIDFFLFHDKPWACILVQSQYKTITL